MVLNKIFMIRVSLVVLLLTTILTENIQAQEVDLGPLQAGIKHIKTATDKMSGQLDNDNVADSVLQNNLRQLIQFDDSLQNNATVLQGQLSDVKNQLQNLGPEPAKDEPAEPVNIKKLRRDLNNRLGLVAGLVKSNTVLIADISDLLGRYRGYKRSQFRSKIGQRSHTLYNASHWHTAITDIIIAFSSISSNVKKWHADRLATGHFHIDLILIVLASFAIITLITLLFLPFRKRFELSVFTNSPLTKLDKERRLSLKTLFPGLIASLIAGILYLVVHETKIFTGDSEGMAVRLWILIPMLVIAISFARNFLVPNEAQWSIIKFNNDSAVSQIKVLFITIFILFAIDRIFVVSLELLSVDIEALELQAALSNIIFAVLFWLMLRSNLWQANDDAPVADDNTTPQVEKNKEAATAIEDQNKHPKFYRFLLILGRFIAVLILITTLLTYARLGNFVYHRIVASFFYIILFWGMHKLFFWFVGSLTGQQHEESAGSYEMDDQAPLRPWLELAINLVFIAVGLPVLMLILGFDWLDVKSTFDLSTLNIRIGSINISYENILNSILTFLLVSFGTRLVTGFLNKRFKKKSHMQSGARQSIITLVNYSAVLIGLLLALSILGIDLAKLALIGGALSVGIGFGLQGIVNNFVAGLILLFERPIKTGDWIVVNSTEGYVKNIGARATEILTFDKSTIILPNSELVTSPVTNWFHGNKFGRIKIDVGVDYDSDPDLVSKILLDCAAQDPELLKVPLPTVRFLDFGDSALIFSLRVFIKDYDKNFVKKSELRTAILKAFREAGIVIAFPQLDLHVKDKAATAQPKVVSAATHKSVDKDKKVPESKKK